VQSLLPTVWPAGTQLYTVYARDTNGCFDTARVKVTVKPAAVLDLPEKVALYPGESYKIQPGGNALYYKWFPHVGLSSADIANPEVRPDVNTRYIVKATTEFNCSVTDSIDIIVMPDSHIEVPNAFAPSHSTLKVIRLGEAKLKSFAVFNRWGIKVFETNNIDEGWDGKYKGEAQSLGVYVYRVEAETYSGRKITRQGNVTLIR
jgi:gliding motility-associated-like protein